VISCSQRLEGILTLVAVLNDVLPSTTVTLKTLLSRGPALLREQVARYVCASRLDPEDLWADGKMRIVLEALPHTMHVRRSWGDVMSVTSLDRSAPCWQSVRGCC